MKDFRLETRRQMIHAAGIVSMLLPLYLGRHYALLVLGPFLLALIAISFYRSHAAGLLSFIGPLARLESWFERVVNTAERRREREEFPLKGAIFFYTGAFFAVVAFAEAYAAAAIAVLALGDSVSTVVGMRYGRHKLPINPKKSWEGSLAFLYTSYAVLFLFTNPLKALLVALVATGVEMLPDIDDNLTIPVTVGFMLTMF